MVDLRQFIEEFKTSPYYNLMLKDAPSKVLAVYVGGSLAWGTQTEYSDIDLIMLTTGGKYVNSLYDKKHFLKWKGIKVHWYAVPVSYYFGKEEVASMWDNAGRLTIHQLGSTAFLYKSPAHLNQINKLIEISKETARLNACNLFNALLSGRAWPKKQYFLTLCAYLILSQPLDLGLLTDLSKRRHLTCQLGGHPAKVQDDLAQEQIRHCQSYMESHPVDVEASLNRLYTEYLSAPPTLLCKHNFGEYAQIWNPWYGCHKVSEGCANCYIRPVSIPANRYCPPRFKEAPAGNFVSVCLQSDFFLEEADSYRPQVWEVIKNHPNRIFLIITKRVGRIKECLPDDWRGGYDNVILCATIENQKRADERLPVFLGIPTKHRWITCSPLLESIDITKYLKTGLIEHVEATGERDASANARPTKYEWSQDLSRQCSEAGVRFTQLYLGSNFIMPNGQILQEWAEWYRCKLAESLDLSYYKPITFQLANTKITY